MIDIGKITDLKNYATVPVNKYVATVTAPVNIPNFDSRTLAMRCESAELPGKSIPTSESRLYGPIRKIPYNLSFIDSTFTFMCSQPHLVEKRFFDGWADHMVDPDNFNVEYYDNLSGQINLKLLNDSHETIYEVNYIEVFPMNVSALSLGYGQRDDYAKFSVTFSYRKWKKVPVMPGEDRSISGLGTTSDTLAMNLTGGQQDVLA